MKILKTGFVFILITLLSCSNQSKEEQETTNQEKKQSKRVSVIKVNSPKTGDVFTVGENIPIEIQLKDSELTIDSLVVDSDGNKSLILPDDIKYSWNTEELRVGDNRLRIRAYSGGDIIDSYSLKLRFKSDIIPEEYTCKIIETYPHNKTAYTQGLVFEDGILYEGTGQRKESVIRKIDFEKGETIAELNLPPQYFGEGITIFGDKIIQLTWTSRKGFVYDKNSFQLLTTIEYYTQGWGITTDGKKLLMSDGSETIHFLDPEYFNEQGKIQIYDQNGPVQNINELEYFNGLVYANVWQTAEIIAFDIETGKVVKRIDCSNAVPQGFENDMDNVLNGIAYDHKNDKIFITGKRWPVLYLVEFVKK